MSNKDSCANRIRKGLEIRGMTQADLCRVTNIPKSAMSQYCNGGLVPRQERTFLIAQALDVSEAWLMGFEVPMERKTTPAPIEMNEGCNIIRIAGRDGSFVEKRLSDEQASAWMAIIEQLPDADDL